MEITFNFEERVPFKYDDLIINDENALAAMLLQAIGIISVQKDYANLTPEAIFDIIKKQTENVRNG